MPTAVVADRVVRAALVWGDSIDEDSAAAIPAVAEATFEAFFGISKDDGEESTAAIPADDAGKRVLDDNSSKLLVPAPTTAVVVEDEYDDVPWLPLVTVSSGLLALDDKVGWIFLNVDFIWHLRIHLCSELTMTTHNYYNYVRCRVRFPGKVKENKTTNEKRT